MSEEFDALPPKERQKVADKITHTFSSLDKNHDGRIVQAELQRLLRQISGFKDWSDKEYDSLFSNADWNCDSALSFEEFVDWILQIEIPQLVSRGSKRYPVYRTREIQYPNGVMVPLNEVKEDLLQYLDLLKAENHPPQAAKLRAFMRSKTYNKTLHRYFVDADASGNGKLEWNSGEITKFCLYCFDKIGLPRILPGDSTFHKLYNRFDLDTSGFLSERECLCMMDAVLRALCQSQRDTDPEKSSSDAEQW